MDVKPKLVLHFDDFNQIKCECGKFYHPEDEETHKNSVKHRKYIEEIHLTEADKKLIKKFKKLNKRLPIN